MIKNNVKDLLETIREVAESLLKHPQLEIDSRSVQHNIKSVVEWSTEAIEELNRTPKARPPIDDKKYHGYFLRIAEALKLTQSRDIDLMVETIITFRNAHSYANMTPDEQSVQIVRKMNRALSTLEKVIRAKDEALPIMSDAVISLRETASKMETSREGFAPRDEILGLAGKLETAMLEMRHMEMLSDR